MATPNSHEVQDRHLPSRGGLFEERPVEVADWNLFDLGIADIDGSGRLGIFTANHNSRQSFLIPDANGHFVDTFADSGLSQDPTLPGWEEAQSSLAFDDPGLYIYWRAGSLIFDARDGSNEAFHVRIQLAGGVHDVKASRARVSVTDGDPSPSHQGSGATLGSTQLELSVSSGGTVKVKPQILGQPIRFTFDDSQLPRIFLGREKVRPNETEVSLELRDRHGIAWDGTDEEGSRYLFICRGGMRGWLERAPFNVEDELFVRTRSSRWTRREQTGLAKRGCRSRAACWVPIYPDEPLSLFTSCAGTPPRLFRQRSAGSFADASSDLGLDQIKGDRFAWYDIDHDGSLELLATRGEKLAVYARADDGSFHIRQAISWGSGRWRARKLSFGDWSGEGFAGVFVACPRGNALLRNHKGLLEPVPPSSIGLPDRGSFTANWVDFDNDGRLDLHSMPGGLFRQSSDGVFERTGLLDVARFRRIADARAAWFDPSNSGARDLVVSVRRSRRFRSEDHSWVTRYYKNRSACGHWLEISLQGPKWNETGIGALVTVKAGGRTQVSCAGCSEGSHFSQGHYRIYFGLGDASIADAIKVQWPGGAIQRIQQQPADELISLSYSPDSSRRGG